MTNVIKGTEIERGIFSNLLIATEMIPEETRFVFYTGLNQKIPHIASKYNIKDYSPAEIGSSFQIIVYNIFESD